MIFSLHWFYEDYMQLQIVVARVALSGRVSQKGVWSWSFHGLNRDLGELGEWGPPAIWSHDWWGLDVQSPIVVHEPS